MSDRPEDGNQVDAINRFSPFVQTSFDLARFDKFVTGLGVDFIHYKAVYSPIGLNDRGDYRRDGLDTITSDGAIWVCAGKFTATMTDNSRDRKRTDGGTNDPSKSRLVLPRFYNKHEVADGDRIYMGMGDRIYYADPDADVLVSNTQKLTFSEGENLPMFPIVKMETPIFDSKNVQYTEGVDFTINSKGSICWIPGGKSPGNDPVTGKGRVYSIRYLYKAYYYVTMISKEVRVTNVTEDGVRTPERAPYFIEITRENIYHSQNRGDPNNATASKTPDRAVAPPPDNKKPQPGTISVDMTSFSVDGSDQS